MATCHAHNTCSGGNGDGAGIIQAGCNPNHVVIGNAYCATNITTLTPISALSAVEIGPGPNENDDAYVDGLRRMADPESYYIRTGSAPAAPVVSG